MNKVTLLVGLWAAVAAAQDRPNIVFIMCDDLGYGDVQCLNPEHGKIATPGMDRLAAEGMTFKDAHSGSSVCTPTRYGLLTGRYAWRTTLQKGVVQGFHSCLIADDRTTVASFLKSHGYHTGIVGKWHLDCRFLNPETGEDYVGKVNKWTGPVGAKIPDGPVHRGFDYFHGIQHARSMRAIIENDVVIEHDDVINFLPRSTKKCVEYIHARAAANEQVEPKPFFLYVPLGSPHTPIVPTKEWQGKSGLGDYGDFVMQTDHAVVAITEALAKAGFAENTLVVLTSDNGCSKAAGIPSLLSNGHRVSAHLRGSKADIWDGGHRVPFFARWPGKIAAGSENNTMICLTDWFATVADILQVDVPDATCEDSFSFLPALKGSNAGSARDFVVHHSVSGHFAARSKRWKLALARGSGGWSSPNEKAAAKKDLPEAQLYDMESDVGEQVNLYTEKPEVVAELMGRLKRVVARGRSTEGPPSTNDVRHDQIKLWKSR